MNYPFLFPIDDPDHLRWRDFFIRQFRERFPGQSWGSFSTTILSMEEVTFDVYDLARKVHGGRGRKTCSMTIKAPRALVLPAIRTALTRMAEEMLQEEGHQERLRRRMVIREKLIREFKRRGVI